MTPKNTGWAKEVKHIWVYALWFYLYDIQKHVKLMDSDKIRTSTASWRDWIKRHKGIIWGNGKILCLNWGISYPGVYNCQNSSNFILH